MFFLYLIVELSVPVDISSDVNTKILKEIGSYLDTELQRDTENRLQFGYRNPAGKSAPNWIPESRRKSALIWTPKSFRSGFGMSSTWHFEGRTSKYFINLSNERY
ncbi:uncharacterized protein OCT59_008764 [Rhizophagus irregularis]|uniref:uncharacterized protein n=1 Tax=Rhizophagus irregularis TaxID=588596 RepID=UPI00331B05BD|nr:hypothetical protein OCT59_008764 [Rhizophagus irregularis]